MRNASLIRRLALGTTLLGIAMCHTKPVPARIGNQDNTNSDVTTKCKSDPPNRVLQDLDSKIAVEQIEIDKNLISLKDARLRKATLQMKKVALLNFHSSYESEIPMLVSIIGGLGIVACKSSTGIELKDIVVFLRKDKKGTVILTGYGEVVDAGDGAMESDFTVLMESGAGNSLPAPEDKAVTISRDDSPISLTKLIGVLNK